MVDVATIPVDMTEEDEEELGMSIPVDELPDDFDDLDIPEAELYDDEDEMLDWDQGTKKFVSPTLKDDSKGGPEGSEREEDEDDDFGRDPFDGEEDEDGENEDEDVEDSDYSEDSSESEEDEDEEEEDSDSSEDSSESKEDEDELIEDDDIDYIEDEEGARPGSLYYDPAQDEYPMYDRKDFVPVGYDKKKRVEGLSDPIEYTNYEEEEGLFPDVEYDENEQVEDIPDMEKLMEEIARFDEEDEYWSSDEEDEDEEEYEEDEDEEDEMQNNLETFLESTHEEYEMNSNQRDRRLHSNKGHRSLAQEQQGGIISKAALPPQISGHHSEDAVNFFAVAGLFTFITLLALTVFRNRRS